MQAEEYQKEAKAPLRAGDPNAVDWLKDQKWAKMPISLACKVGSVLMASEGGLSAAPQPRKSNLCVPNPPKESSTDTAAKVATVIGIGKSVIKAVFTTPVVWVGVTFSSDGLAPILDALGLSKIPAVGKALNAVANFIPMKPVTGVAAFSIIEADLSHLPADIIPKGLAALGVGGYIADGLTLQLAAHTPESCVSGIGGALCRLVRRFTPKSASLRLTATILLAEGTTASIGVGNIKLSHGITLSQVALMASYKRGAPVPDLGISGTVVIKHRDENLMFTGQISQGFGVLTVTLSMVGTWKKVFGIENLDISNLLLSSGGAFLARWRA